MNFLFAVIILIVIEILLIISYWALDHFDWPDTADYLFLAELMVFIQNIIKIIGLVLIIVGIFVAVWYILLLILMI